MADLRQRIRTGLVVVVCGAAWLAALAAESAPDPDLSTENMHRAGPIHFRPFVALKDLGYDDNVRFDAENSEGDTTATVGAGLHALMLAGNQGGLRLDQEIDYVAFGNNSDLNHWSGISRARGILLLQQAILSLEDRFTSVRERPNTEVDRRVRRENNALTAAFRSRWEGRVGLRGSLLHQRIGYSTEDPASENVPDRLNRDVGLIAIAAEIRIRPKTTLLIERELGDVDFDDDAERRDSRTRRTVAGFRFDPSAPIQGEIKVGRIRLEAPDRPENDTRSTVGEARIGGRLSSRARLRATFERDLVFSTLADNLYYIGSEWSAAYQHYFTRRLSSEILFGRGTNHYPEEVVREGGDAEPFRGIRDDHLTRYRLSVRYEINDQLSMMASGEFLERDSTDDFYDRDRTFYSVGSTFNF